MDNLHTWLQASVLSNVMTDWKWAWAWAEVVHYLGMSLFFGCILLMDLRLIGFFRRQVSLHHVHSLTPWALAAFLINLATGLAFFVTRPKSYLINAAFELKMTCVLLASINFLMFWLIVRRQVNRLAEDGDTGLLAKFVGASSIVLWTLVIWSGRMIPVYGLG